MRLGGSAILCATLALACGDRDQTAPSSAPSTTPVDEQSATEAREEARAREEQARIDAEFPGYALVTGVQLPVRAAPEPNATVIGWLRLGAVVRVKTESTPSPRCATVIARY